MKRTAYQYLSKAGAKVTTLFTALLLVVAAVVATPAPAGAHNQYGWGWCNGSPAVCVSTDANGYGDKLYLNTSQGYCRNMNSLFDNRVTGIDSHIGVNSYFWSGPNCTGSRLNTCGPWCTIHNLYGTPMDNTISSYCIGVNTQSSCGYWF
jgi:hypothetical protein